ncbi:hypothetical protein GS881_24065 [Rhodococcus hoagii]|nr:hypothetical protein [Prescottella equi]
MATVTGATEHLEQLVRDMEDAGPGATESRAYRAIVAELKRRANEDAPDAVPGVEGEEIRSSIQEGTDPMTEDSPTNDLPFPMARADVAKWAARCDRAFEFSDAQLDSLAAYANRYPDPAERLSALWDGASTFDASNRIPDGWDEEVEPGLYGRTRDLAHYPSLPPGEGRHSFNLAVTQFERFGRLDRAAHRVGGVGGHIRRGSGSHCCRAASAGCRGPRRGRVRRLPGDDHGVPARRTADRSVRRVDRRRFCALRPREARRLNMTDSMRYAWRRMVVREPAPHDAARRVLLELESYADPDGDERAARPAEDRR